MLSIVVAHSANNVIGHRGRLPWRLPSDLRRFKELTTGGTVVMGRKTFESLPDAFRPLPGRRNVVVSSNPAFDAAGAEVHTSLDAALDACKGEAFVIGGGSIYSQAVPLADRVYATHVAAETAGDAFFPALAPGDWRCVEESEPLVENDLSFTFRTYDRSR